MAHVLYCTYWRFGSRVPNSSTRPGSLALDMVGVGTAASGLVGNRSAGPRLDEQGGASICSAAAVQD
jgi:hypothetical protein